MRQDAKCCEFVIVRHGQSNANSAGILQGQEDFGLDNNGIRQAEAAAVRLHDEAFDLAFSSPLTRARHTAQVIVRLHPGLELQSEPAIAEWAFGELEGMTFRQIADEHPEIFSAFFKELDDLIIPGGESKAEFQSRIYAFLDRIADRNMGKRILLVTHGGVIQRIFRRTTGPIQHDNLLSICDNASISVVRKYSHGWQLVTWNECGHLRETRVNPTLSVGGY